MFPFVSQHPQIRRSSFDVSPFHQSQQPQPHQPHLQPDYGFVNNLVASSRAMMPLAHGTNTVSPRNPTNHNRQYTALPLQKPSSQNANAYSKDSSDSSEHMLRRKTPNGTLSAAYDGTPVEWASQQHAMKHILVPVGQSANQLPNHLGDMKKLEYHDGSTSLPSANASMLQFSQPLHAGGMPLAFNGGVGMGFDPQHASFMMAANQSLGMDSMLNQPSLNQPQQFLINSNGMQIPTALQPSFQSFPGPTASNEGGPYGPYWPNGAYIPYRPAPFQDPRFHGQAGMPLNPNIIPFPNVASNTPGFKNDFSQLAQPVFGGQLDPNHYGNLHNFSTTHFGDNFTLSPHENYANRPQTAIHTPSSTPNSQVRKPFAPFSDPTFYEKPPLLPTTNNRSDLENFREKILSWAHTIYVKLLIAIHNTRRHSQHNSKQGVPQPIRNQIYPKPPRQPGSQFAIDANLSNQRSRLQVKGLHPPQAFSSHQSISPNNDYSRPKPGVFGATNRSDNDAMKTLRRASGTAVVSAHSLQQEELSRRADAKTALDMLAEACETDGWQWIDGLLLGGCLAYGLADYNKALQWYSKILALDKNHVEATSNLAATLLSLNRRDEAERYWLRAVKLRPSYFEAVEHLIGLLCGDNRGKEAVSIIEFVESSLKITEHGSIFHPGECLSEDESERSRASSSAASESEERVCYDYDYEDYKNGLDVPSATSQSGFGTSGYCIPGSENGRILALIHAKGNMLYALQDNAGAAKAFEDAILIVTGRRTHGISGLIERILSVLSDEGPESRYIGQAGVGQDPILLPPKKAEQTVKLLFPNRGELPGLTEVREPMAKKAAISTTSNSLLSLAKIFQDGMASSAGNSSVPRPNAGVRDILALYYLSLSLQPSPSTANNVGILLASVQQSSSSRSKAAPSTSDAPLGITGVVPGSGIALALDYYNYGLQIDSKHAHLYTNLGSLLKDIGHLNPAIRMYELAVSWDGNFDIALANLANAVKDQGRVSDAIRYYKRAVIASPDFPEAVCGLANALNSVCSWVGRGGVRFPCGKRDRWHVDEQGRLVDSNSGPSQGWMKRVVEIVAKQLKDGETWGKGILTEETIQKLLAYVERCENTKMAAERRESLESTLRSWIGKPNEGAKIVRLVERLVKRLTWRWYQDFYITKTKKPTEYYSRPRFPSALAIPSAPTVLPFHTFTCPLTAKQIRTISQRNGLRISCTSLRSPWLPNTVFNPPAPPSPVLKIGYVSSDFNNHPLAHLMQSVFGFHDPTKFKAVCYATTASDNSVHRKQIEKESPVFHDASGWSADKLVEQIVRDGIHILINLNGYTRGARNEVFAARAVPIQMSFMGFAGTLGSEWCDYILADDTAIPPSTLRPWRRNVDVDDQLRDDNVSEEESDWVYSENIIFSKDTFFCCDHRQSAPDSQEKQLSWSEEQSRRWDMRKKLFPSISDDAVILGNFNQLYKIEPTTFRTWLRILSRIPNAILWLLRFPELGESNLKETAKLWAGQQVADRIIFTDVAPKHQHISRARVCDLFLDTPECNAHTTAADVLWSGTPLLTLPRYQYKMCSRMAASILKGALPKSDAGKSAARDLIATSEENYEELAVKLASQLVYPTGATANNAGHGTGRLMDLRRILYEGRWTSALFDTRRWVRDLEQAYEIAWKKWVAGEGGDIWL